MIDMINPIKLIDKAKKTKNTQNQIITLIIASFLMAIAAAIIASNTMMSPDILIISLSTLLGFFTIAIITTLIYSFILKTMTKKGTFYDSLTAITISATTFSAGAVITALMLLLPNIGYLLGLITLFTTIITSIALFFRAITTMTNATILEVITTSIILIIGLVIATQLIVAIQLMTEPLSQNAMQGLSNNTTMNMQ